MKRAMILPVGEQPAANLLPTRQIKPDAVMLVYTDLTRPVAGNLEKLLEANCNCLLCKVHPYRVSEILDEVRKSLSNNLADHALTFNLTGGTKPMALAAFSLARMYNSPFVYFQTEGNQSRLYHYTLAGDEILLERVDELPDTITLDDYLRMYVGNYETGEPRNDLERQVKQALCSVPDLSVLWSLRRQGLEALEIDFVVRLGNQIGVGEVKTKGAKSGIDQIAAVTEQRHLGTYVQRFLISGKPVDRNNKNLAEAYKIEVLELASYSMTGTLCHEDRRKLTESVLLRLGGTP